MIALMCSPYPGTEFVLEVTTINHLTPQDIHGGATLESEQPQERKQRPPQAVPLPQDPPCNDCGGPTGDTARSIGGKLVCGSCVAKRVETLKKQVPPQAEAEPPAIDPLPGEEKKDEGQAQATDQPPTTEPAPKVEGEEAHPPPAETEGQGEGQPPVKGPLCYACKDPLLGPTMIRIFKESGKQYALCPSCHDKAEQLKTLDPAVWAKVADEQHPEEKREDAEQIRGIPIDTLILRILDGNIDGITQEHFTALGFTDKEFVDSFKGVIDKKSSDKLPLTKEMRKALGFPAAKIRCLKCDTTKERTGHVNGIENGKQGKICLECFNAARSSMSPDDDQAPQEPGQEASQIEAGAVCTFCEQPGGKDVIEYRDGVIHNKCFPTHKAVVMSDSDEGADLCGWCLSPTPRAGMMPFRGLRVCAKCFSEKSELTEAAKQSPPRHKADVPTQAKDETNRTELFQLQDPAMTFGTCACCANIDEESGNLLGDLPIAMMSQGFGYCETCAEDVQDGGVKCDECGRGLHELADQDITLANVGAGGGICSECAPEQFEQ